MFLIWVNWFTKWTDYLKTSWGLSGLGRYLRNQDVSPWKTLIPQQTIFPFFTLQHTAAGTPGCCWRISAFPHLFQTTPLFFFRSHQIQLSESLLVLFASSGKWGQEALQMPPNRFRKPKVLLHIPVIIDSEDQSKTTKMEPEKTVVLQNLGVKALTSVRDLLSTGLNGCCFAPFFKAVLSFSWLCASESSVWPQRAISTKSDVMNNF